ncbi:MAG: hypothetical protein RLZZ397_193 [Pseudomonadota bacterium]
MTGASDHEWLALDEHNRQQALDGNRSFIVQAPAGAGKTELLTQRFLTLLQNVEHPEEIVALTFTNKAAAEMRKRIVESLLAAHRQQPPSQAHKQITYQLSLQVLARDQQLGWGLLQQAGRLQITTLDALCARLARHMPVLSRFGSQPSVTTDAEPFYQRAAQLTLGKLDSASNGDKQVAQAVRLALAHFENDRQRLEGLLLSMLASRDQWLTYAVDHTDTQARLDAQAALSAMVRLELEAVSEVLPHSQQLQIMAAARFAAAHVQEALAAKKAVPASLAALEGWHAPLRLTEEDLPLWQGVADLLLTRDANVRKSPPKSLGLTTATAEGKAHKETLQAFLDAFNAHPKATQLARVHALIPPIYDDREWELINSLVRILKDASAELWLAFQEAEQVDFIEITQNALRALGDPNEPTDLALQLDYQIRHLLIDEFQDTSPVQVDLLNRLTTGWQANDGRSLFLVGDPMQSIYRFRKADVGLFLHVQANGIGQVQLQPLQLYRNNRSDQVLVEWVNDSFAHIFSDRADARVGAVRFEPAAATRAPLSDAGVHMHPIPSAEARESTAVVDANGVLEAQRVIQIVRQTWTEDRTRSVAVLVRARGHLKSIVEVLRKSAPDLPFQAVEIESLGQRQCILDLVSLTHALHHRADRVHWLALLRAPWCGLLLEDLHRLAHDDHRSTIWRLMNQPKRFEQLSADGQQRLAHVREVLHEALEGQGRMRPRQWIESTWQGLGGPHTLKSERDLLDVQAYFELLDEVDVGGALDLQALERQLNLLYAAPEPHTSEPIQIMTIHKSKGLEFDTVILPGLHRQPRNDNQPLMIWDKVLLEDGREHLAAGVVRAGNDQDHESPRPYDLLQAYEKSRSANESKRLLYVAVTRAIRKLHLLAVVESEDPSSAGLAIKPPLQGSLLKWLWPTVETSFTAALIAQAAKADLQDDARSLEEFKPWLERLRQVGWPAALAPSLNDPVAPSGPAPHHASNMEASPYAVDVGVLTHRYLELIAKQGLTTWSESRVQAAQPQQILWFKQKGYNLQKCHQASQEVQQHLLRTLRSERGRWILSAHESAASETPFTTWANGQLQQHVIDRTFVHDGVRWIVDYKTTVAPDSVDDTWVADQLLLHREQLLRYVQLFKDDGLPVRAALYLTGMDCWIPLDE